MDSGRGLDLPRWDVSTVYPGLESDVFRRDFDAMSERIGGLVALFDEIGVDGIGSRQVDESTVRSFDAVVDRFEELAESLGTISAYIRSFVTTDSRNDTAQALQSELMGQFSTVQKLETRFTAWIGSLDVDTLISGSVVAREREFALRKRKLDATHQMSPLEEDLAAELSLSGGTAWSNLQSNISSQLTVRIETIDGGQQEVPITVARNMQYEPDRDVRQRAFEAEIAGWERVAVPLAAALNSIKGESNTLARRRDMGSVLDVALVMNNIDRETLDAMLEAARASFPDFRRYLRAKAQALGVEALAWYDITAPLGKNTHVWNWSDATEFLLEQFATYSERLRDYAERAFREHWIDAEPRPGKRGGAFCMRLRRDESRILANYVPSLDGVSTLAHELGHGYHNINLAARTPLQRETPMTLAETASIFCETIIRHAAMAQSGPEEQLAILESSLQGDCQVVVDITSRFLFEQEVLERRQRRELSVDELNETMLRAQRSTYGDGLDEAVLHPYMWAVKGHYYRTGQPFYNFPYMFGLLFGLGLFARYQQDPSGFHHLYDELLSLTGMADAATLASRFDIDIRTPAFWNESLALIRGEIDRFETLVKAAQPVGSAGR